jgi:tetratricopeptide (TPR) repeat protein
MALGKYPEAEAAFQSYIKLIPNNANPYDSYAEFLMKTGRFDDSIKQYQMSLDKDPTFVNSYRGMGNDYEYKGDYAKARETYQTMFARSTNDFNRDQALSSTMNSWVAEGNIAKALETNDLRIAMAEKVGDVAAVINLHNLAAFICADTGDAGCAEKHLAMATKLADDPSLRAETKGNRLFNTQSQQVRFLTVRGDFDGARTQLEQLRQYASTRKNFERAYYTSAGNVELAQKNYAKANEFYAKGNPSDPYLWYSSAQAYEAAGDTKTAMELYRKVAAFNELDTVGYALVRAKAIAKIKN